MASPPGHLTEIAGGVHILNLDLKNRLDRLLNLRLGRATIDAKRQQLTPILRLFLGHQRFFRDDRRLDYVPNGSHWLSLNSSVPRYPAGWPGRFAFARV